MELRKITLPAASIFLLAILLQLWAPVATCAGLSAAADPVASRILCAHPDLGVDAHDSSPVGEKHGNSLCCAVCVLAYANVALLGAAVVAILLRRAGPPPRIALYVAPSIPQARWIVASTRPRAPPAFS